MTEDTLRRLTLDQKITMMGGADAWHTAGFDDPPVPAIRMSDGPAGVRGTSWSGPPSASFPCGAALGATFDPALVREIGEALGRECRAKSVHVLLAPTVNLQRTPIGGRNFECYSEDPHLTAELAVAFIDGVQSLRIAACVKHLVGNDTEFERMSISSEIDEATLRELYLVPFEAAVRRAGVRSVMAAYNKLNGTFCSEHRWLLSDVLRGEWGFDGVVVSDWFGCHSGAASLRAGLDVEMPGPPAHRGAALKAEIEAGAVSEVDLDRAVRSLLELAEWTGAATTATDERTVDDPQTRDVIHRAAIDATVLLKNDGGVLPLTGARRVALIGPNARDGRPQGGGSAHVRPTAVVGPLDALVARGFDVEFEPGGFFGKTLPPLNGEFTVALHDHDGHSLDLSRSTLRCLWEHPPSPEFDGFDFGGTASGTFTPDVAGTWELGLLSIGPSTLRLDEATVVEVPPGRGGGVCFGLASPESRARVELEAGRQYRIVVDYPQAPARTFRGFSVGARHIPAGDPIERAASIAAGADVAIVVVGTDEHHETEGEDRPSLTLPGEQDALVAAVVAANRNTVVVLNCGSPVTMPWLDDVPAVVQLWFPGQDIGNVVADVVTGAFEPGGRLPVTFPRSLADTPAAAHYPGTDGMMVYGERQLIGYRWFDRRSLPDGVEPVFPFGHGLGYTTFTIGPAAVGGDPPAGVTVAVDVANIGERPGSEVVQVYVEPVGGDPARPVRQLAGFRRVRLEPGAAERVDIELWPQAFQIWDGGWRPAAAEFRVLVGRSSRELTEASSVPLAS